MHKKFQIKGGCQSGRKVVTHNSKSDLHLSIKNICSFVSVTNTAAPRRVLSRKS